MDSKAQHSATTRLQPPQPREDGWTPIEPPVLEEFKEPGTTVIGRLISIAEIEVKGRPVIQYTLALDDKRVKFLGTYDLVQKLNSTHRGMSVRIKYLGTDPSVSRNGNEMKIFDVQVRDDRPYRSVAPASVRRLDDGTQITDEDIPF
jgi:hypothetical protein